MSNLHRALAPIPGSAWSAIDDEAKSTLKVALAGRQLADFDGPLGWQHAAVTLGRTTPLSRAPGAGVAAALRRVQPLVEIRVPFVLMREELEAHERGAKDADFGPVTDAATTIAAAEDNAIFQGFPDAGIEGICSAASDAALTITEDYEAYPGVVANALSRLRNAGIGGPYAIALGPKCHTGLLQTTVRGGFPVIQHVQRLIDGPVIWAPALHGAVVVSLRGGDFELTVGRDLSIGYSSHTATTVELYLEESFTFRVLTPEAAVPLVYGAS